MAAETGFMIEGELCEFAQVFSFDLDEAQILYENTGLTIEDFLPFTDDDGDKETLLDEKLKNPGFVRTLMHVAYKRKHQGMPAHKVKALIGKQSLVKALQELSRAAEEDDAVPPALTTEQEPSSLRSSVEKNDSSGNGSLTSSDGQVVPLAPTTTSGSGISSTPSPASSAV